MAYTARIHSLRPTRPGELDMSFRATKAAIHNPYVTGTHKLVLIIIGDHENENGSWPSIARIGELAGLKPRRIKQIIKELVDQGELLVEHNSGRNGTNRYFLVRTNWKALAEQGKKLSTGGATQYTPGALHDTQGVQYSAPKYIKKDGTPSGPARDGDAVSNKEQKGTPPGSAGATQTTQKTQNYIPPRCTHNPTQSVLKCEQCSEAYRNGEI